MTIFEAIKHCKDRAEKCDKCGEDHRQLQEWMEELLQYREIGTVEECREAVEKQKPIKSEDYDENLLYFVCPSCRCTIIADEFLDHKYCLNCGQAISWEESEKE